MSFAARMMTIVTTAPPVVQLPSSLFIYSDSLDTATVTFYMDYNGTYYSDGNVFAPSGTWLLSGAASDYDVRFTVTSGAINNGGTTGSWLSLGTTRSWSNLADPTPYPGFPIYYNVAQAIGTLEIRSAATAAVLTSSNIELRAVSTNA